MKNRIKLKYAVLALLVVICSSADLYTKWLAKTYLEQAPPKILIENFLELRYTENSAIAFSLLHTIDHGVRKWIIYSLSSVAIFFLGFLIWSVRNDSILWLTSLMLILSGAVGNIAERLFRGYVIDFIHAHYHYVWSWPVFNVADIFITCGAILLTILMLFKSPKAAGKKSTASAIGFDTSSANEKDLSDEA